MARLREPTIWCTLLTSSHIDEGTIMHTVQARPLTKDDVVEGLPVLIRHGAGYVPGKISHVSTKEINRTESRGGPVTRTGTEVKFGLTSDTGFETGKAFHPDWLPASEVTRHGEESVLVADAQGEVLAQVVDIIGAAAHLTVFAPDLDPVAAEQKVVEILEREGLTVWSASTRVVSEQRVNILDLTTDAVNAANVLEAQGSLAAAQSAYRVEYLPFDGEGGFKPRLSQQA